MVPISAWPLTKWDKGPQTHKPSMSKVRLLKTVAFIAGKKNPAGQNFYIHFSIEIKLKNDFHR